MRWEVGSLLITQSLVGPPCSFCWMHVPEKRHLVH